MNIIIYATCHGIGLKHYLKYFVNANIDLIFIIVFTFNHELNYDLISKLTFLYINHYQQNGQIFYRFICWYT